MDEAEKARRGKGDILPACRGEGREARRERGICNLRAEARGERHASGR